MSNSTQKRVEGNADKLSGAVKQGIGAATGNERLRGEGAAQESRGRVKDGAGKVQGFVEGAAEELKGGIKKELNR